jgi:hypothetical protein
VHPISKHVRHGLYSADRTPLDVEHGRAVRSVLDEARVVAPSGHDVAIAERLVTAHCAGVDALWMEELGYEAGRVQDGVDCDAEGAGGAVLRF